MPKYTAFCQEITGRGTIWIQTVDAKDPEQAQEEAKVQCAEAWDMEPDAVHCLGIAEGDVNILIWEDIDS